LQQVISRRLLVIAKRDGKELSPDIGTKAGIPAQQVWDLLRRFGCYSAAGRSTAQLETAA